MTNAKIDLPDFIIIGAMKCATSTLHEQLALLDSVHMSTPKEPNFFSDDHEYAKGMDYYSSLFQEGTEKIKGESSTHYTKFPTYPETIERMIANGLQDTKFIYIIRHPIDRLISHYIHEWTRGIISSPIDSALTTNPELVSYSKYHFQLSHYLSQFDKSKIKVVFYESLISRPDETFSSICEFLNIPGQPSWNDSLGAVNQSKERIREFPFYNLLINSPIMAWARRKLVPQKIRAQVKSKLQIQDRPDLSSEQKQQLSTIFDEDLKQLGQLFNIKLDTKTYSEIASKTNLAWT